MRSIKYDPHKGLARYYIVTENKRTFRVDMKYGHTTLKFAQKRGIELSKKTGLNYKILKLVGEIKQE